MDLVSKHLAKNARDLRAGRGLSQAQAAKLAEIPRATWTHLESGSGNPTLAVLVRVANALQVTLEELIAPPRSDTRLYRSDELVEVRKGTVDVRELLPDPLGGLQIERMFFRPGTAMRGVPHTPGTREYLVVERGTLQIAVAGKTWTVEAGDLLRFRGDQAHGYVNRSSEEVVAFSVVVVSPTTR